MKTIKKLPDRLFKHWCVRAAISSVVVFSFFINCVCFDLAGAAEAIIEPLTFENESSFSAESINIPLSLGDIKERFSGTNGKTIIHIQDAHCNYAAQTSIGEIIDSLTSKYSDIDLLSLEGGAGDYDLSLFTDIRDGWVREKVSDYFMKEGRVSGPEKFGINNPGKVELFGIEDEELYYGNLEAYRGSLQNKEEADRNINSLSSSIENLKRHIYSETLKDIDTQIGMYRKGDIGVKGYVGFLVEKAKENSIDMARYTTVNSLVSVLEQEKLIDFAAAEKERKVLVYKIGKKVPKTVMEEIMVKTLQLSSGEILNEDFYSYLFMMANFSGVEFSEMPNLVKYAEYMRSYDELDRSAIFIEIDGLEDDIMLSAADNEGQKELYLADKDIRIMRKMSDVSLVKEEFLYYEKNKSRFNVKRFLDLIEDKGAAYGDVLSAPAEGMILGDYLENMEKFYEYSFKRDEAFVNNIDSRMNEREKAATILVTGGFHTGNLSALFRDKGYSYVEVMPKFGKTEVPCQYFDLLAGRNTPFENLIEKATTPQGSGIAVQTIFSAMRLSEKDKTMQDLKVGLLSAIYTAQKEGRPFSVDMLVGDEQGRNLNINFSRTTPGEARDGEIRLDNEISVVVSSGELKEGILSVPDLVLDDSVDISKLKRGEALAELLDAFGIESGTRPLTEEETIKLREVLGNQENSVFGLSGADVDVLLGETGMHGIRMWNAPIKVFRDVEQLGHLGKREINGEKTYGEIYLSPTLLEDQSMKEVAIGILHEVGELYGMTHNEVLDLGKASAMGDKELKDYAAKVVARISETNRVPVPGTAMTDGKGEEEIREELLKISITDILSARTVTPEVLKTAREKIEALMLQDRSNETAEAALQAYSRIIERASDEIRGKGKTELEEELGFLLAESDVLFSRYFGPGTAMARYGNNPEKGRVSMRMYDSADEGSEMIAIAVERGLLKEEAAEAENRLFEDIKILDRLRERYASQPDGRWDKDRWIGFLDAMIEASARTDWIEARGSFSTIRGEYLMSEIRKEAQNGDRTSKTWVALSDGEIRDDRSLENLRYYLYDRKLDESEQTGLLTYWKTRLQQHWEEALAAEGKDPKRGRAWTVAERILTDVPGQKLELMKQVRFNTSYSSLDYAPKPTDFYSEAADGYISVYTDPWEESIKERNKRVKKDHEEFLQGWSPWIDRVGEFGKEVLETVFPGLFDGQKSVIIIGIPAEEWDAHLSSITGTKAAAQSVTSKRISKDINVLHFKATAEGVENLKVQMKKYFNVSDLKEVKSRIVGTAPMGSIGPEDTARDADADSKRKMYNEALEGLNDVSYKIVSATDYVNRFPVITPVGASVFTGLALLNKSYLEEKEKQGKKVSDTENDDAINLILKGMSIMSGGVMSEDEMKGIAKRIRAQGYSLAGIELVVVIRPIDINQIKDFHEKDRLVMRSL